MANKPFKILSIDGGGIKGLYSATVLERLEEKAGKKSGECFDMICGTSTGGLIALGLASGKSSEELARMYLENGKRIFPTSEISIIRFIQRTLFQTLGQTLFFGKFSQKALKETLDETYGTTKLGDLNNLVCIPSFNLISGMPRMFKYPHKEGGFFMDKDISLVDAGLATSAAPTYLPVHEIGDKLFIDGGLWANNPSMCGLLEALKFFVGEEKEFSHVEILSIPSISQPSGWLANVRRRRSFLGWRSKLIQIPMDGQAYFTDFFLSNTIKLLNKDSKYIRLKSPTLSSEQMKVIDMDRADKKALKTLRNLGDQDGYTNANNPDIMSFFKTLKNYKTV